MSDDKIVDGGSPRKYFTILMNIAVDGLPPYQLALYAHYVRVCGDGGVCWEGARATAERTGMSVGMVSQTREELRSAGWISCTTRPDGGLDIAILDRWAENMARYTPAAGGCSPHEQGCSPGEHKNIYMKKTHSSNGATPSASPQAVLEKWRQRALSEIESGKQVNVGAALGWLAWRLGLTEHEEWKDIPASEYGRAAQIAKIVGRGISREGMWVVADTLAALADKQGREFPIKNIWTYLAEVLRADGRIVNEDDNASAWLDSYERVMGGQGE